MPELSEGYKELLLGLSVPGLYCLLVLAGRRLKRRHGVQLGWLYHLFSFGLAIYVPALLLNLQWPLLKHLGAALVILGSVVLSQLLNRYLLELYFQKRHGVVVPKFLSEVVLLALLLGAVVAVLELGYDTNIRGLLIAPGIAAVIIGLGTQDMVGNIISGLALQAGKSFAHGDWLMIDNRPAQVIEINWRSTRLRTMDDVSVEVPNREIARQTIINLNRPARRHAMRLAINLDYGAPPTRVKDVLVHAAANARGVAPEPRPKAFLKQFGDSAVEYEIKFWLDDHAQSSEICDAIRTNLWYSLRRHGLRIPYPTRTLQLERPPADKQQHLQTAARQILRRQPLFQCLSDEHLDALLPRGRVIHYGRGEKVIQQGENGDSMFILVEGEANVVIEKDGGPRHIASLAAGDCFGEMSLLTGERRSATVVAHTDCEVVEIAKPVLANSLKEHPELLEQLSQLLAKRQLQTNGALASQEANTVSSAQQTRYAAGFLSKLRSFFEL